MHLAVLWQPLGLTPLMGLSLEKAAQANLIWQPGEQRCFPILGHLENCFIARLKAPRLPKPSVLAKLGGSP